MIDLWIFCRRMAFAAIVELSQGKRIGLLYFFFLFFFNCNGGGGKKDRVTLGFFFFFFLNGVACNCVWQVEMLF